MKNKIPWINIYDANLFGINLNFSIPNIIKDGTKIGTHTIHREIHVSLTALNAAYLLFPILSYELFGS
jgi:hypothetical protein